MAKKRNPKAKKRHNVPHVIKGAMKHIQDITVQNGMVKILQDDGKTVFKTFRELDAMVANCELMLKKFAELDRKGTPVPAIAKKQTQELILKVVEASREAKHQLESVARYDHRTQTVKRVGDNLEWQRGGLKKERGEYTEDHLPFDSNVQHYMTLFPHLTELEVAGMLKARHISFPYRIRMMRLLELKRVREEQGEVAKDLARVVPSGEPLIVPGK